MTSVKRIIIEPLAATTLNYTANRMEDRGIAGRRTKLLAEIVSRKPDQIETAIN